MLVALILIQFALSVDCGAPIDTTIVWPPVDLVKESRSFRLFHPFLNEYFNLVGKVSLTDRLQALQDLKDGVVFGRTENEKIKKHIMNKTKRIGRLQMLQQIELVESTSRRCDPHSQAYLTTIENQL